MRQGEGGKQRSEEGMARDIEGRADENNMQDLSTQPALTYSINSHVIAREIVLGKQHTNQLTNTKWSTMKAHIQVTV